MILKDKRVSQGLTTKQIAKRLDVGVRTIQYYERNERIPRGNDILDVAEAYDLSIEEMLNWLEEMKNNKKEGVM